MVKMTCEPQDFEGRWPDMDRACDAFEAADCPGDRGRGNLEFKLRAALAVLCPQQAEPVAWLHKVRVPNSVPLETDDALSFSADSFPLGDVGLFESVSHAPLYLHPPAAQAVCDSYAAENQQLSDEAQRLREALKEILVYGDGAKGFVADSVRKIARRALEGK